MRKPHTERDPLADNPRMNRTFLMVLLAALLGVGGALLAYDHFVVQPRAADAEAGLRLDLRQAREEAQQITDQMQASVEQNVAGAQQAMDAQAREQEMRRLARDAIGRAAMFKAATAEHYMSNGAWPDAPAAAGLPAPEATAGGAVLAVQLGTQGTVDIQLGAPFPAGSGLALTPDVRGDGATIEWRCSSRGDPALPRYLPECH